MFRQNKNKQQLKALASSLGLESRGSFGQTELSGRHNSRDIRISTFSTGAIGSGGTRFVVDASDWGFTEFRISRKSRADSTRFPDAYEITADNPVQFTESFAKQGKLSDFIANIQQRLVFNGDELEYVTTETLDLEGLEEVITFLYDLLPHN